MNVYREFSTNNKNMQDTIILIIKNRIEELCGCSVSVPMIELNQLRIVDSIGN